MAVKKLRINEDVKTPYRVYWGGTWNNGSRSFSTEQEMIKFFKNHVFDDCAITIEKIEQIPDGRYSDYIKYRYYSDKDLTDKGSKEIFRSGITTIDNLKDTNDD